MADRAASAAAIRATVAADVLNIKVTRFEIDPELSVFRSVTSDSFHAPAPGASLALFGTSVVESAGGIIRGTGYVDPVVDIVRYLLQTFAYDRMIDVANFSYADVKFIYDVSPSGEAPGARYGHVFSQTTQRALILPMQITGNTDDAGMVEVHFEIHSQGGTKWSQAL